MLGFFPVAAAPLASLGLALTLTASAGSVASTGEPTAWARSVVSQPGTYALTGKDAELDPSLFFRCQTGDFTATGHAATFRTTRASAAGALTLTGQLAALHRGRVLVPGAGAFALTGQPVVFHVGASLPAAPAAFTLSGHQAHARYTLRADAARLASTASTDAPIAAVPLATLGPAAPESLTGFVLGGSGVGLRLSRTASAGAYHLTGASARFIRGPVYRIRWRDLSGPLVAVLEGSGPLVAVRDQSAPFIAVRDASEGLP